MRIEQLQIFPVKDCFNSSNFESDRNNEIFKSIASSVSEAFLVFSSHDISYFDKTCRSNMLNNLVVKKVQEHCTDSRFCFVESLTNTRRSIGILDDEYIILFKKSPVANVRTNQDDLIKNQELNKHVIFLTYQVDEFWSELSKVEFQYFTSPNNVSYTYDISYLLEEATKQLFTPIEEVPAVGLKKIAVTKRKAQ
jgi:hypothetical protein